MAQPQPQQNMAQPQLQQNDHWTRIQQPANSNLTLKGMKVRMASGISLIVTGVAEIIIACILLSIRFVSFCGYRDRIAWGIWAGVLAVTTGCFGCFSRRSKCVVIAFLVLGIINAVISAEITIFYGVQTACGVEENEVLQYIAQVRLELALYILMFIVCAFQMVMSIIGASFTCAICSSSDPMTQQLIVNQPSQMPYQNTGSSGLYGAVTSTNGQE